VAQNWQCKTGSIKHLRKVIKRSGGVNTKGNALAEGSNKFKLAVQTLWAAMIHTGSTNAQGSNKKTGSKKSWPLKVIGNK